MPEQQWKCRYAPSLGPLEDTPENIWGTEEYEFDIDDPTVFFGLYGFPDFYSLWRHKGKRAILWTGSDIRHFVDGYWLEEGGSSRLNPQGLADWINKYCESWVENEIEYQALKKWGIESKICPSFLGKIENYEISFKPGNKLYTSVSGDEFKLYGWDKINDLAEKNPDIEFHLYGTSHWFTTLSNVTVHGRVSKEEMNSEIKDMQGALRLTEFDGFSEIIAKSVLWGQWPVSLIEYQYMLKLSEIRNILDKNHPNIEGRDYYQNILNRYPWNQKLQ